MLFLPICREKIWAFNVQQSSEDFIENDLLSQNQYAFKLSDSCINQWISITKEIYQSFDDRLGLREVFFDISKAFDKFGMTVLFINWIRME